MKTKTNYQINEKFIMKKNKKLLLKQNTRHTNFKEIHRSYVEIQNKLKLLEEKIKNV